MLIARLLGASRKQAHQRADDLLEQFDLTDAANRHHPLANRQRGS